VLDYSEMLAQQFQAELTGSTGEKAKDLLQKASELGSNLIVVRWTGTPQLDLIARRTISEARASVLVVKQPPRFPADVLVCSGGHVTSETVIKTGAQIAQIINARVTLLHVATAVPSMYTGLDAMDEDIVEVLKRDTPASQHLRSSAEIFHQHGIKAVLELRHGHIVDEIARSNRRHNYDLIIIGASDVAPPLNRLFLGDVTLRIVSAVPCTLLVARPGLFEDNT
jgi:nucleotide-binding universal stress UspA family protein